MEKELLNTFDKELLLKDLCARLPYKVKVEAKGLIKTIADEYDNRDIINAYVLNGLNLRDYFKTYSVDCIQNIPLFNRKGVCNVKPYLFPLSSMTEKQKREYDKIIYHSIELHHREYSDIVEIDLFDDLQDFYHKNHLDYRGLIEKGLALNVTGLNIY